jgi:hypothetical protein
MRRNNERGSGRISLLVTLAVVGIVAFAGIKIIPVRINAYNFRDVMREECRMGAVRNSDQKIAERIMERAEELEVPLKRKDLRIKRTQSKMIISAKYDQAVDLKVATYTYKFDETESAPLF